MSNVKGLLEEFKPKLKNAKGMDGVNATYQFKLADGDDHFYIVFAEGNGNIAFGETASPDLTLRISEKHLDSLLKGKLNPTMAAMTGKLKIKGDMSLAMKLQNIL
ncbi:putative sterol carrier protein [Desulfitispora alkaliphila]|uniref:SCP2 sterol-binding domain-containing protein n=1 Tax=Desulfitispora alkaliphila TaxID=622674 RepID=UPI003D25AC68